LGPAKEFQLSPASGGIASHSSTFCSILDSTDIAIDPDSRLSKSLSRTDRFEEKLNVNNNSFSIKSFPENKNA
jgi:hypothetical protein